MKIKLIYSLGNRLIFNNEKLVGCMFCNAVHAGAISKRETKENDLKQYL